LFSSAVLSKVKKNHSTKQPLLKPCECCRDNEQRHTFKWQEILIHLTPIITVVTTVTIQKHGFSREINFMAETVPPKRCLQIPRYLKHIPEENTEQILF